MYQIRLAIEEDEGELHLFLKRANHEKEDRSSYCIVEKDKKIVATIGYQQVGTYCLLTTFVFSAFVDQHIILGLFEEALQTIRGQDVDEVYLVTRKATGNELFSFFGFRIVQEEEIPAAIYRLEHYQKALEKEDGRTLSTKLSPV